MISSISDQITHNTTATANTHSPECLHVSPLTIRCTHGPSPPQPFNAQGNREGKRREKNSWRRISVCTMKHFIVACFDRTHRGGLSQCDINVLLYKRKPEVQSQHSLEILQIKTSRKPKKENTIEHTKNRQCVTKSTHLNDDIN